MSGGGERQYRQEASSEESCFLSIITPVYNGADYIEFCIRNVIGQNCPGIEHIIIDGGSTDSTAEIISKYAAVNPHIRWVSEKDEGQSHAMNKAIAMARGSIVGFLNADDYYEPDILCRIVEIFQGLPAPSLLVGNCNVWDNEGRLWFVSRPAQIGLKNLLLGRFLEAFPMNPSAYFYHKSLHQRIGMYDTGEHFGMDLQFIFQAVQKAKVTYLDETWGNYRYLEGTKTYEDDKSGGNGTRVKQMTLRYRQQQPLYYRVYLLAIEAWIRAVRLIRRPFAAEDKL
ncbi:MAG: hypothetical protein ACD_55C00099G0009 [uncultured bacterium]|uniref:Glycosyltransferase n=1 Tax=Citrifermentans bemidjiense (strain ATCC BAA-1014 / DSM 16622 / JCM 12645 / Bem) TaxID=404380 RepID=B5EGU9_CITBB|nr:glycosyltransferase family 2 protein [Citrifermentans bemidjiense]ACH39582.1 glycosyltransferase [Citrifermentans bemidjiense Bem]EKD59252.1 MAG: hypothetical protein ACD_55C00099G0009 [uncultured bacterium]